MKHRCKACSPADQAQCILFSFRNIRKRKGTERQRSECPGPSALELSEHGTGRASGFTPGLPKHHRGCLLCLDCSPAGLLARCEMLVYNCRHLKPTPAKVRNNGTCAHARAHVHTHTRTCSLTRTRTRTNTRKHIHTCIRLQMAIAQTHKQTAGSSIVQPEQCITLVYTHAQLSQYHMSSEVWFSFSCFLHAASHRCAIMATAFKTMSPLFCSLARATTWISGKIAGPEVRSHACRPLHTSTLHAYAVPPRTRQTYNNC